jgi:hypothetical protein
VPRSPSSISVRRSAICLSSPDRSALPAVHLTDPRSLLRCRGAHVRRSGGRAAATITGGRLCRSPRSGGVSSTRSASPLLPVPPPPRRRPRRASETRRQAVSPDLPTRRRPDGPQQDRHGTRECLRDGRPGRAHCIGPVATACEIPYARQTSRGAASALNRGSNVLHRSALDDLPPMCARQCFPWSCIAVLTDSALLPFMRREEFHAVRTRAGVLVQMSNALVRLTAHVSHPPR